MDILVSTCNVFPGRPVLCLVEADTLAVRVVQLPGEAARHSGARGLWASERFVFVAMQEGGLSQLNPPALHVFDRETFDLLFTHDFRSTRDVHSIWGSGETMYVASTGTDEVLQLEMRGPEVISETVLWRPEPDGPRADVHHINALCEWRGDLLISAFGKRATKHWSSAVNGFIFNVTRREKVLGNIDNPHSLAVAGDTLFYCESRTRTVRACGNGLVQTLPGYTRGLSVAGGKLYVGTSIPRRVSKSTGQPDPAAPCASVAQQCSLSRLSAEDLRIEASVDLGLYGQEIYDLLPIANTARWPLVSEDRIATAEALWEGQVRRAAGEIKQAIPPGTTFSLLGDDAWGDMEIGGGRRRLPFLERDGQYWAPTETEEVIEQIGRVRQSGAAFLAFAWPSFWWFWSYPGLLAELQSLFRCTLRTDRLFIFDLRNTT